MNFPAKVQQTVAIPFSGREFIKNSNTNFPSFMSKSISDVKHIKKRAAATGGEGWAGASKTILEIQIALKQL